MKSHPKYAYPGAVALKARSWPDKAIDKAPVWCSVDLRDGNQALPVPMNPQRKLAYFEMLCRIGFKEIEAGFPSASKDDFDFIRELVEKKHVPSGVRISVLTQARRHLIERTVESLKGVEKAILHLYVATSDLHGRFVFNKERADVAKMAVEGTEIVIEALEKAGLRGKVAYEFSPEEFTDSDPDFVAGLCEQIKEKWGPCRKEDFILNLPATVERRPPYQYADMIEYFCGKYRHLGETTISLHAHNDQGCAVAATEMALLAGGERVEGTLFGHGERTGNVDIVTLALNLHSRGICTGLDFSDLMSVVKLVEAASGIPVHQRQPYAGELVFTAFSGSHQDAIRKGLKARKKAEDFFRVGWKVPYLHIDPSDVGRKYERLIRINSQSGKGGAAYVLENEFGYVVPKSMHPEIGDLVQALADSKQGEIVADELLKVFRDNFLDVKGPFVLEKMRVLPSVEGSDNVRAGLTVVINGRRTELEGEGNGPVSAAVHALNSHGAVFDFVLEEFSEQALGTTADATAVAYVGVRTAKSNRIYYGAGQDPNIDHAAVLAVFAALNKASRDIGK